MVKKIDTHAGKIQTLGYHNEQVWCCTWEMSIKLYSSVTQQLNFELKGQHTDAVSGVAFSFHPLKNRWYAWCCSYDSSLSVWILPNQQNSSLVSWKSSGQIKRKGERNSFLGSGKKLETDNTNSFSKENSSLESPIKTVVSIDQKDSSHLKTSSEDISGLIQPSSSLSSFFDTYVPNPRTRSTSFLGTVEAPMEDGSSSTSKKQMVNLNAISPLIQQLRTAVITVVSSISKASIDIDSVADLLREIGGLTKSLSQHVDVSRELVGATKKLLSKGIQIREQESISVQMVIDLFENLEEVWTRFLTDAYEDQNPLIDLFKVLREFKEENMSEK